MKHTSSEHGATPRAKNAPTAAPNTLSALAGDEGTSKRTAAIYVRVSTLEQAREGVSLDTQEHRARQYANLHGLRIIDVYRDEGWSAKSLSRPGIQALLASVQAGSLDDVVVDHLDRLTRSIADFTGKLMPLFEGSNVAIHSVSESIDTSTATGRFGVHMLVIASQWMREQSAERVYENLRRARSQGYHMAPACWGWDLVAHDGPGSLLAPKSLLHQAVIREARKWHESGAGLREVGRVLTDIYDLDVTHPQTVKSILVSPLVEDMIEVGPNVYRWPA